MEDPVTKKSLSRDARYDLVILGGGTGGLVSAMIAAGIGARVALIESDRTGGDCLWTGCVPSKSLLAAADLAHAMRHADRLGLAPAAPAVDLAKVMEHVRAAQATIAPHDSPERLRDAGVDVIEGTGRFVEPGVVAVGDRRLRFRRAIIATGSSAVIPPIPGLQDVDPLTNETVWDLTEVPSRLAVIGGGPIGCELGQAFARLGSRVTIVDMEDRVLPREEPAASDTLAGALRAEGVELRLGAGVQDVERTTEGGARLTLSGPSPAHLEVDRVLVAAGRRPRTADLGLELVGVQTDRGAVTVDGTMRTSNRDDPRRRRRGRRTGLHARRGPPRPRGDAQRPVRPAAPRRRRADPVGDLHRPGDRPRRPDGGAGARSDGVIAPSSRDPPTTRSIAPSRRGRPPVVRRSSAIARASSSARRSSGGARVSRSPS